MTAGVAVFALLLVAFAATARSVQRARLTAPVVFLAAGTVLALLVGPGRSEMTGPLLLLAETALALLLFHDAAQVRPRDVGADLGLLSRLLLLALPLTIALGAATAWLLLPGLTVPLAVLLAAAVSCTDAGLGAESVHDRAVPARVRRLLTLENGLDDGIGAPVALFAVAVLAGDTEPGLGGALRHAGAEVATGLLVGLLVGGVAGHVLRRSADRGTSSTASRTLGVLAVPVLVYCVALLAHGNGFVAAFAAGAVLQGVRRGREHEMPDTTPLSLVHALGEPLALAVWFAFGFAAVPLVLVEVGWREAAFAVLSITLLRAGPVALALLGSGLRLPTVAFVGWSGPRGLDSVVLALIALESLGEDPVLRRVVAVVSLTVGLSPVLHGFASQPLARRYGRWAARAGPGAETAVQA